MHYLLLIIFCITGSLAASDCENCETPSLPKIDVPEWPIEYVDVEKIDYIRNPKASFCKRPVDFIDTIVLHHTQTASVDTPEYINHGHLSRGPKHDPWYMIGYSYTINSPYAGDSSPRARVTEGRPLEIVGAHAGADVWSPMDEDQKKMFEDGKITCGFENGTFAPKPGMVVNGKISSNVTTIGLAVIGNYSPMNRDSNPGGYSKRSPRYPTKVTLDLAARMACQLQKKHPRMKNIKWHSYYHSTSCPGTIKQFIGQIKALARNYGCEFN